ncbi:MAG: winged helix-turn-helix transcriptional regulator [Deltaproteobacteria bacterium]|nr:winged helix-turn-helix transcriptional regulator [Deltaproteobacteria bacterium]
MTIERTPEADILTDIILAVFRVNGRLLEIGDQLVKPLNLTSARWQVLTAAAFAGKPLSAPQIAEAIGITRQGAQKQINKLKNEGFLEQRPNPRHERSPLYVLTETGNRTFCEAMALQGTWANGIVTDLSSQDLKNALRILNAIHERFNSPVPTK